MRLCAMNFKKNNRMEFRSEQAKKLAALGSAGDIRRESSTQSASGERCEHIPPGPVRRDSESAWSCDWPA